MTTRYRMTTDVRAWRVGDDGSLPDDMPLIEQCAWGSQSFILPRLIPGNWVVSIGPGRYAQLTDEAFRACCTSLSDAGGAK